MFIIDSDSEHNKLSNFILNFDWNSTLNFDRNLILNFDSWF